MDRESLEGRRDQLGDGRVGCLRAGNNRRLSRRANCSDDSPRNSGAIIGGVTVGGCLAGVSLTNGSTPGVVEWTILAGISAGSAAGAVGGVIVRLSFEQEALFKCSDD